MTDHKQKIEIVELAPTGLGFGEGLISTRTQLENPESSGLTLEALRIGAGIIKSGTPFVEVDTDANDDGCGDGRPTGIVYRLVNDTRQKFNKSRRRAKVFGGGLVVAASMYRAVIGGVVAANETVLRDRSKVADLLDQAGISYGGHTDNHAHGNASGCGAIDKYPLITENALRYRQQILATLQVIYEDEFDNTRGAIDQVFVSYADQVDKADSYFKNAEGIKTKELMEQHGSVIKQLNDDHLEDFIVVNDINGTTFDQRGFDEEMIKHGVKGTAQVFVVDTWRGRMYADFIADQAKKEGRRDEARVSVSNG